MFVHLWDATQTSVATFWHLLAYLLSGKKHANAAACGDLDTQIAWNSQLQAC